MLSFNVSGLLRAAPGTARTFPVSVDDLPLAPEIQLAAPVEGEVRLTRTGRSIFATANLTTSIQEQCSRCLVPVASPLTLTVEEEALPSVDPETGKFYLHCAGGRHRTGVMGAVYRFHHDKWNFEQAMAEMNQFEFGSGMGHGKQKSFVEDYWQQFQAKNQANANAATAGR